MIGAILGDIIGSIYEHNNIKRKDFPLFSYNSRFTDDTVMTVAIAEAMLNIDKFSSDSSAITMAGEFMHIWGRRYEYAGYARKFMNWLLQDSPIPYQSFGNGSAMRVSPVAWIFKDDFNNMRRLARATAMPTHNHPEGIKGADAVASAMGLALMGKSKKDIRDFIEREFQYDLHRTCDEIRPEYQMNPTCQGSVPEAIIAFLDGTSYEDVIRNAVSIGGDSDTIAAISGGIAEAYYGLPDEMFDVYKKYLTDEQVYVVECFLDFVYGDIDKARRKIKNLNEWRTTSLNENISKAIKLYKEDASDENYIAFLESIRNNLHFGKVYKTETMNDAKGSIWLTVMIEPTLLKLRSLSSENFTKISALLNEVLAYNDLEGIVMNPNTENMAFITTRTIRENIRVDNEICIKKE